jgi:PAS domain S-box-containing protein
MDGTPTIDPRAAPTERLLAIAPDLLGAAGHDGVLRLVNPAWTATLGWTEEQLRSTAYLEVVHPEDRPAATLLMDRLVAGESVDEFACRMQHAGGGARHVLWSARGSREDGCIYFAGTDITERRRLEDQLALAGERLDRMSAELQDFAYVASHDLAEPLRMVTSYLDLLQRRYGGQLDETADEFIGYAVGGAVRMRALIDDLLAYSRVGSHDMQPAEIDLGLLLAGVLEGIGRTVAETGAVIEPAGPLAPVRGDPAQVAQLLQSLLVNAVKFHAGDGPRQVTVACVEEQEGVTLTVRDNGIGIPRAQQERIFKMFTRLHGRDEYAGTGMGLALCRRIAERHGGRIRVESEPGAGSAFHVWLPR